MDFVSWKHRKPLAAALKGIYRAVDAKAAEEALTAFEASEWGQRYPAIGQSWRRAWSEVIPFFAFDVTPSFPPAGTRAGLLFCASTRLKQWAA
jgi:transposase-like protein